MEAQRRYVLTQQRTRVQLDFSPEAHERLLRIRKLAEARTNAEVVRNALRLYDWFMTQRQDGFRVQLLKDDAVKEVELIF
ncbi:MAG: hypothetical protein WC348_03995 [Patescibacteria group bacterium]